MCGEPVVEIMDKQVVAGDWIRVEARATHRESSRGRKLLSELLDDCVLVLCKLSEQ